MRKYFVAACTLLAVVSSLAAHHMPLSAAVTSFADTCSWLGVGGGLAVLIWQTMRVAKLRLAKESDAVVEAAASLDSTFLTLFVGATIICLDQALGLFLAGDHRGSAMIGLVLPFVALGSYLGLIRSHITK